MRYLLALLTFILCFFIFAFQAEAGISLSQAIVLFEDDGKRSEDVVVLNQGKETVYVRVEPSIIHNPGSDEQMKILLVRDNHLHVKKCRSSGPRFLVENR